MSLVELTNSSDNALNNIYANDVNAKSAIYINGVNIETNISGNTASITALQAQTQNITGSPSNTSISGSLTIPSLNLSGYVTNNSSGVLSTIVSIPESGVSGLTTDLANRLLLSGGTMTGNLTVPSINLNGTDLNTRITYDENLDYSNATNIMPLGICDIWSKSTSGLTGNSGISYFSNTGYFVSSGAGSGGGQYSSDGVNWTTCTGLPQFYQTSNYVPSLGYGIAIPYNATNIVLQSTNGITWTNLTSASGLAPQLSSSNIIFSTSNSLFVFYNGLNLYTSPTGSVWTLSSSSIRIVSFLLNTSNYILSIGSGGPQYSTNGITWLQPSSTQDMSLATYSPQQNIIIATPLSTNLNNYFYSPDQGITWLSNVGGNLSGTSFSSGIFIPSVSRHYFAGKTSSNLLTLYSTCNFNQPLNGGPVGPNITGTSPYGLNLTTNNRLILCFNGSSGHMYSTPTYGNVSSQPMRSLIENRISTIINSPPASISFVSVIAQQIAVPTILNTACSAGYNFTVAPTTGIVTYNGPSGLNFEVALTFNATAPAQLTAQGLVLYLEHNSTILQGGCTSNLPINNTLVSFGASCLCYTTLNNSDTIGIFGYCTATLTVSFSGIQLCIRQLYN